MIDTPNATNAPHAPATYRAGLATDAGRVRVRNEDRAIADEAAGTFLVVDGMGGHAEGERAAEIAVEVIGRELSRPHSSPEARVREAITQANNEIFRLAQLHEEWRGMACVLTLALIQDDRLTVGHVGDSRLYLAWTGGLRKLTSDHSPVGELEDRGDLTEAEAMRDPRRNQVFRDVGSQPRESGDENFIELKTFPFRSDAAFLVCTDGLSDAVTHGAVNEIVQRYEGDARATAEELVRAANEAGGRDNVTVIFIPGPEFTGSGARATAEGRARHAVTRVKKHRGPWAIALSRFLWLIAGAALGIAGLLFSDYWRTRQTPAPASIPRRILANPADPLSLKAALASARPGDVVEAPRGVYEGPLELREGVDVVSASPGETVVLPGSPSSRNPGVAVAAHSVRSARISGFRMAGTDSNPLSVGVLLDSSAVEMDELEIAGARSCGLRFTGNSAGALRASYFHDNGSCNVLVEGESSPRIVGNRLTGVSVEVRPAARPYLSGNIVETAAPATPNRPPGK